MTNSKSPDFSKPVTAKLFRWLVLRDDGSQIIESDNPDEWAETDTSHPELVEIGVGSLAITAAASDELARTAGCADDTGALKPTVHAVFTPSTFGGDVPQMGDLLALDFGGFLALSMVVVLTHADIHTPSMFDLDTPIGDCFAAIKAGEIVITTLVSDTEGATRK
jgi:hypothetical protein